MDYERVLNRLCTLSGPSGFETQAVQGAAELLRPLVDQVYTTRLGSLVGVRRCGKEGAPRLLLDAHLDEVGFIVTGHEEGFLRFASLGGVDARMLPDRELLLLTEPPALGIVTCMPPHLQSSEEAEKALSIDKLYLDVGCSQEEARENFPIGTPAVCRGGCTRFGEALFCGKALDDRAGFAVLLDVLERLQKVELYVDLYVLGSTQEETSSAGAITSAYGIAPDLCVAVDVTHGDTPDADKDKTFTLSGGPVLGVGPNCSQALVKQVERCTRELEIPIQLEVMSGSSGTNAWPLQISREGIATAVLSLPLRYMHTPIETVHRRDLEETARLLAAFVEKEGERC